MSDFVTTNFFHNSARVVQDGNSNLADIFQSSDFSRESGHYAEIKQDGFDNQAMINQSGDHNGARINQIGDSSYTNASQTGFANSADIIQMGNGNTLYSIQTGNNNSIINNSVVISICRNN